MEQVYDKAYFKAKDEERGPSDSGSTLMHSSEVEQLRSCECRTFTFGGFTPISPFAVLVMQLLFLTGMVSFVVWTSVAHQPVPRLMADLYLTYPQSTATVITLIGSLLSLINTKLFADAVRFAICVSLKRNGLSLYSLHATASIASRSPLFDFDSRRIRWAVISLIYFSLFTIETSAWSTIFTPRPMLMQSLGSFEDIDFSAPPMVLNGSMLSQELAGFADVSLQAFESGVAAVRQMATNTTQLLPYSNNIINGTSRGILPIPNLAFHSNNWTQVEVIQQGLSADVSCQLSDSDPAFSAIRRTGYLFNSTTYHEITLLCNGTNDNGYVDFPNGASKAINIIPDSADFYLLFTVCPAGTANNVFTMFMQLLNDDLLSNITCTIKPHLLNVNVTYSNSGIVTINSTEKIPIELPANTSTAANAAINSIKLHLPLTQSTVSNSVVITLYEIFRDQYPNSPLDLSPLMAAYLRGVIEDAGTIYRQTVTPPSAPYLAMNAVYSSVPTTIYTQVIVWGQVPQLRLMITIAPMVIMTTTISIAVLSLYRARKLRLKHDVSFDPMNILHIIAACSSGNVQAIQFPDYSEDIGTFCKYVGVGFPEGRGGKDDIQGFHFSH